MDGHDTEDTRQSPADMTAFVQNLLQQMQNRFQTMSNSIISKKAMISVGTGIFITKIHHHGFIFHFLSKKITSSHIDEMGSRIDELEQSINELRAEMGMEGSPSPSSVPTRDKLPLKELNLMEENN